MDSETALYFSRVLSDLKDAEVQFKFNQDNTIMNGYPVRIMDECSQKLAGLAELKLPDAEAYPKLHAYMVELQAARDCKAEEQRKHNEYMQSPDGRREQRLKQIEELKTSLRLFERDHMTYQTEAANYITRAENAKRRMELTKSILSDLEAQAIENKFGVLSLK